MMRKLQPLSSSSTVSQGMPGYSKITFARTSPARIDNDSQSNLRFVIDQRTPFHCTKKLSAKVNKGVVDVEDDSDAELERTVSSKRRMRIKAQAIHRSTVILDNDSDSDGSNGVIQKDPDRRATRANIRSATIQFSQVCSSSDDEAKVKHVDDKKTTFTNRTVSNSKKRKRNHSVGSSKKQPRKSTDGGHHTKAVVKKKGSLLLPKGCLLNPFEQDNGDCTLDMEPVPEVESFTQDGNSGFSQPSCISNSSMITLTAADWDLESSASCSKGPKRQPRGREAKPAVDGLVARLRTLRRTDQADQAFWEKKQMLPHPPKPAESFDDGLPSRLHFCYNRILRSDRHLMEIECQILWGNAGDFSNTMDAAAPGPRWVKIILNKTEYDRLGFQHGGTYELFRPWIRFNDVSDECPVLFCPHYFRKLNDSK
ncbi:uncharacterized protein LOC129586267 isoform X2 [Paramacrobiotus metropolitanus]|uniref:uncharacterized protein LOC129586267 isoform X2 n=1 Tax=Paramacrobiotus metropolitanus TaxID=2943436 RepID=UPI0024456826|nr:uncharacterized protein LOC129586267 isoform X2 [Paramacrobiotus metropolitanus]